jgi:hypothetical protein
MRKTLLPVAFLFSFFLFHFSQAQEIEREDRIICVGFYNLENLFDTINDPNKNDEEFLPDGANRYTGSVYLDKLHKLASVISQIAADISDDGLCLLGCAEVENRQVLEDLVKQKEIRIRDYEIVHYNSPDERGVDVALLYNPKYFRPVYSESLFVPLKNNDSTYRYTRDILYVYGELKGEPYHIFVNHWPSRRGGEEASAPYRALAAGVCRQKIDSIFIADRAARIIVMGDLNDDPINESVARVLKATGNRAKISEGKLFNPWHGLYKEGIGSLAYNDAWNLFDQIIISPALVDTTYSGFHFSRAAIFNRDFLISKTGRYKGYPKRAYSFNRYIGGYSDHFPTYIILSK